ncbi:guanine deaminase [Pseudomonas chengduensis]|nr:guanine deaminase [Pseudomonas chengduensis]MDH1865928.1 guanine deaminase [Pseudomonas chengduensis]
MSEVNKSNSSVTAIRGQVLSYKKDPFKNPIEECVYYESDGIVVMEGGKITAVGPASDVLAKVPSDVEVTTYDNALIVPGFIDCHVHYPQTEIIGAYGKQLIDWLNKYTFVAEQNFKDEDHAREVAKVFLREGLRCGTTTSTVFCTVDPISVDVFFEESQKLNMRNIAGKVLMDRNAPPELMDTAQSGYDQTKELIKKWHNNGRSLYCVTPRFAPTSTPEQMEMTGAVWNEHPGTYLQSHVSENLGEIEWVKELFPERKGYVDTYHHYGQLGERSILGHGVHLTEEEFQVLHDTGTAISHCPTSNLFLGSGLFSIEDAMNEKRPIRVGLATDLGAGTNFSQLVTMNEAYKVAQMNGYSLSAHHAYYLATRGAANALYLDDTIGSIEVGMEADVAVLDLNATPALGYRLKYAKDLDEVLFVLMTLGDDRTTCATYVAGQLVYARDQQIRKEVFADSLNTN